MYDDLIKRLRYCRNNAAVITDDELMAIADQAADAIEELSQLHEAQRQNLIALMNEEPEPKWIPVTERLPDNHGHYLAHIISGEYQQISWDEIAYFDGKAFQWEHLGEEYPEEVTHWMPLPEPPKEET